MNRGLHFEIRGTKRGFTDTTVEKLKMRAQVIFTVTNNRLFKSIVHRSFIMNASEQAGSYIKVIFCI